MAAVKQQVLNWLYSVLTSEYKDVNRTYNDVAQALSHYSSLAPRTDVYTYENGANALLLHISGILPVNYRGTTYRFPIALWVPHAYPREAPLAYVTPAEGMAVRPGQHVDLQGKIYHPYLANWAEYWDKSNLLDFLAILRDVFAKEPPVVARQQAPPPRPVSQAQSPPPIPPLPPGVGRTPTVTSASPRPQDVSQPPPPPPKPTHSSQGSISTPSRYDSAPPLPPLPVQPDLGFGRYSTPVSHQQGSYGQHAPQRTSSLRYETAPPLPQQPPRQSSTGEYQVSPLTPPQEYHQRPPYGQQYQQSQYVQSPIQSQVSSQPRQPAPPTYTQQQPPPSQWQNQSQHPLPPQQLQQPPLAQQSKPVPPPVDLLSEPLTLPTPTSSALTPPPIPPNPEKDLLLHNIARALASQRAHTASQTTTSLPGLAAQHRAMLTTLNTMNAELQSLESLSALLASNTNILQSSLREADGVISSSQHRKPPNVDELLVAPTVVGNQLYETVCEERALGDTLFILGRAVERGRISPATFAKMTRSLAREWFLKKALVRKIGRGMGLNDGH